jgi:hypothetical protein
MQIVRPNQTADQNLAREERFDDMTQIKWNRSEQGCISSKCGRFEIEPIFMGRTTAQAFHLYFYPTVGDAKSRQLVAKYCDTQREGKERAENFLQKV